MLLWFHIQFLSWVLCVKIGGNGWVSEHRGNGWVSEHKDRCPAGPCCTHHHLKQWAQELYNLTCEANSETSSDSGSVFSTPSAASHQWSDPNSGANWKCTPWGSPCSEVFILSSSTSQSRPGVLAENVLRISIPSLLLLTYLLRISIPSLLLLTYLLRIPIPSLLLLSVRVVCQQGFHWMSTEMGVSSRKQQLAWVVSKRRNARPSQSHPVRYCPVLN